MSSIPAFAVATAVLTFAIIIPVYVPSICERLFTSTHLSLRLVLDFLRKGAMTSLTASELGFIGFLWILWLGGCFRLLSMSPCPSSHPPNFLQHAPPTRLHSLVLILALVATFCTAVSPQPAFQILFLPNPINTSRHRYKLLPSIPSAPGLCLARLACPFLLLDRSSCHHPHRPIPRCQ